MSYMRDAPPAPLQRRRRRQSCQAYDLLQGPQDEIASSYVNQEHMETGDLSDPTLPDYRLSAVSLNPEHPPGLFDIQLPGDDSETISVTSLASLEPDIPFRKGHLEVISPVDLAAKDSRCISVLDDHLTLMVPRDAVVQSYASDTSPDSISDASPTQILYSESGDVNESLDMIIFVEHLYVQRGCGNNHILPSLLGTSNTDPFSTIAPLRTNYRELNGIDARFLTPTVDQGYNHIHRALIWNESTGGIMQRLSVFLTDDAARHRVKEMAALAQRIVASVAPGSNSFNLTPRRQAIDLLETTAKTSLLLEVELPGNVVWTVDEKPSCSKTVNFHVVGPLDSFQVKHRPLVLNFENSHSSKCAPCLADDVAEHCIAFSEQAQWRSLRGRGKSSVVHKCCVTVPFNPGPRQIHMYFEHASERLEVQYKQIVQSMSWTTAPKLRS